MTPAALTLIGRAYTARAGQAGQVRARYSVLILRCEPTGPAYAAR